jgi:Sugar (and other) transporter
MTESFTGLNTSLVPMYISEIAPLNLRGGLGTVNQLAVTIGLLLSQVLGIEQILGTNDGWPVLLGLAICPAILQLILLPICPESPRYLLITKQWEEEARKGLFALTFHLTSIVVYTRLFPLTLKL